MAAPWTERCANRAPEDDGQEEKSQEERRCGDQMEGKKDNWWEEMGEECLHSVRTWLS